MIGFKNKEGPKDENLVIKIGSNSSNMREQDAVIFKKIYFYKSEIVESSHQTTKK